MQSKENFLKRVINPQQRFSLLWRLLTLYSLFWPKTATFSSNPWGPCPPFLLNFQDQRAQKNTTFFTTFCLDLILRAEQGRFKDYIATADVKLQNPKCETQNSLFVSQWFPCKYNFVGFIKGSFFSLLGGCRGKFPGLLYFNGQHSLNQKQKSMGLRQKRSHFWVLCFSFCLLTKLRKDLCVLPSYFRRIMLCHIEMCPNIIIRYSKIVLFLC